MMTPDKISGNKIYETFEQLYRNRTLLRLNVLGTDFEGLTIITDIEKEDRSHYLLIDYPGGSRKIIHNAVSRNIFLEYSGKDKLQYNFRTVIDHVDEKNIWLKFPSIIERIQRRKYFRVSPPIGTKVLFQSDSKAFSFNVLNISEGGMLINQDILHHDKKIFYVGGYVYNLALVNAEDSVKAKISIKKLEIRRMEPNPNTGKFNYAVQFLDLGKNGKEKIKDFIYRCQRDLLKRRNDIDDK